MKLYQYKPVNNYSLLNLIRNQIYCNVVNRVNDPFEGHFSIDVNPSLRRMFIDFNNQIDDNSDNKILDFDACCKELQEVNINYFLESFGVSSFSASKLSIPMWGNYSDNHRGICVEYDSTISIFNFAEEVIYPPNPYVLKVHSKEHLDEDYFLESIIESMYTKHQDWKYEEEWRILKHAYEEIEYPSEAITGIYFGLRTPDTDIELVMNAVNHLPHIKFWKAYKEFGNPELQFDEI